MAWNNSHHVNASSNISCNARSTFHSPCICRRSWLGISTAASHPSTCSSAARPASPCSCTTAGLRVVCKRILIQDMPPHEIAKVENEVYTPLHRVHALASSDIRSCIPLHPLTLRLPHRSPSCGSSYQHHFPDLYAQGGELEERVERHVVCASGRWLSGARSGCSADKSWLDLVSSHQIISDDSGALCRPSCAVPCRSSRLWGGAGDASSIHGPRIHTA